MPLARVFTCFRGGEGGGVGDGSYNFLAQDNIVYVFMWPGRARASAASKCLPCLLNERLSVFLRSRSTAVGSALMGHLPLHQGYSLQTLKNSEGQGVFSLEEEMF